MTAWHIPVLFAAGVGGGLTASVAGLASLVSYPVLLALGYPPVTANITNTVALVFTSIGSVSASRQELAGQWQRLRVLAPCTLLGGVAGALLLLATPSGAFEKVVPWLIGLASLAILLRSTPRPRRWLRFGLPVLVTVIGLYGGYFGAAAGVLMLATLMAATGEPLPRANAVKNVLMGLANGVAAVAFIVAGPVQWVAVVPMALGFLVGGRIGPAVVRRAPSRWLRVVIALAGVGLAVYLALDAY